MVVHARKSTANHVLVIDPDLTELERAGQLFGEQGFKVTLSSALLELDSLEYIDPDVLIVRPSATGFRSWRDYLRTVQTDRRFHDLPVIFVAVRAAHQAAMAKQGVRCIAWPWRPLDLMTLVDVSMLASSKVAPVASAHGLDQHRAIPGSYGVSGSD
jgi:CheY-like chemotaxis protein